MPDTAEPETFIINGLAVSMTRDADGKFQVLGFSLAREAAPVPALTDLIADVRAADGAYLTRAQAADGLDGPEEDALWQKRRNARTALREAVQTTLGVSIHDLVEMTRG